jgi:citrate lyase subunit beta/citryl-CoA lyase
VMQRAAGSGADEVFLDLEDGCAPAEKPGARRLIVEALHTYDWGGKTRAVRINSVTAPFCLDDLREVVGGAGANLDCIIIPKVRNAGDIAFVDRALIQLERLFDLQPEAIGIEAQIEDAVGLSHVNDIACASPRLEALAYGPIDFSASMQFPSLASESDAVAHYVLLEIAVAARAAGLQVLDGPYLQVRDLEGLRRAALRSAALGYDGKWVVHPDQIVPCNDAFTPTQSDFDRALRVIERYDHAVDREGRGALILDDEMIDEASRRMAARVVARGRAAGLADSTEVVPARGAGESEG